MIICNLGPQEKLRNDEILCHIPFILLSMIDSVDSKIRGLEDGADVYIEKSFSLGYVKARQPSAYSTTIQLLSERPENSGA